MLAIQTIVVVRLLSELRIRVSGKVRRCGFGAGPLVLSRAVFDNCSIGKDWV